MNCPHCGTQNDPTSRFCIKCGKPMTEASPASFPVFAQPSPNLLVIFSIRLTLVLLLLWLVHTALLRLPFAQDIDLTSYVPVLSTDMSVTVRSGENWETRIGIVLVPPQAQLVASQIESSLNRLALQIRAGGGDASWTRQDQRSDGNIAYTLTANGQGLDRLYGAFFGSRPVMSLDESSDGRVVVFRLQSDLPLSVSEIITSVAYLIAFALLSAYALALRSLWPQAFPHSAGFTPALIAVVYIGGLVTLHLALARPILVLTGLPDIVLVFRVVLFVIAIILLGWAGIVAYNYLPIWMAGLRFEAPAVQMEVGCPHCRQLNPATMRFCGHCGKSLAPQSVAPAETA